LNAASLLLQPDYSVVNGVISGSGFTYADQILTSASAGTYTLVHVMWTGAEKLLQNGVVKIPF